MERAGWDVVGVAVVLELEALGGRAALAAATAAPVKALLAL
jgi:adenine/guanine phosphoribosyltransferase-like PRPP-binding protein